MEVFHLLQGSVTVMKPLLHQLGCLGLKLLMSLHHQESFQLLEMQPLVSLSPTKEEETKMFKSLYHSYKMDQAQDSRY